MSHKLTHTELQKSIKAFLLNEKPPYFEVESGEVLTTREENYFLSLMQHRLGLAEFPSLGDVHLFGHLIDGQANGDLHDEFVNAVAGDSVPERAAEPEAEAEIVQEEPLPDSGESASTAAEEVSEPSAHAAGVTEEVGDSIVTEAVTESVADAALADDSSYGAESGDTQEDLTTVESTGGDTVPAVEEGSAESTSAADEGGAE